MLKCLITAGAYTSGSIPISVYANTNDNYSVTNNAISIYYPGLTNVKANIVFTSATTDTVTAQLYADGVAVSGAIASVTPVANSTNTLNLNDVVKVVPAYYNNAKLTIQLSGAVTLVGGDVICEYMR